MLLRLKDENYKDKLLRFLKELNYQFVESQGYYRRVFGPDLAPKPAPVTKTANTSSSGASHAHLAA